MEFGNIGGLLHGQWRVKERIQVGSATTSVSFSNVNPNKDILISRCIANGSTNNISLTLNADATTYGTQYILGVNTTGSADRTTSDSSIQLAGQLADDEISFSIINFKLESGTERVLNGLGAYGINGTTVTGIKQYSSVYDNTADAITSIVISSDQANGINIDSDFILLELVDASDGMKYGNMEVNGSLEGCWERIATASPTSGVSVTFSGLDGDSDVIYMIDAYILGSTSNACAITLNGDTTTYGHQLLTGTSTTASATRNTSTVGMYIHPTGTFSYSKSLVYAKSGYERMGLVSMAYSISGTTVGSSRILGGVYDNTADNITSITFPLNTGTYSAGTQLDLYRLNL